MRVARLQPRVNCTARYDLRRENLIDECDKKRQSGARRILGDDLESIVPSDYYYLFVDDVHKVLYCTVPKVSARALTIVVVDLGHRSDASVNRKLNGLRTQPRRNFLEIYRYSTLILSHEGSTDFFSHMHESTTCWCYSNRSSRVLIHFIVKRFDPSTPATGVVMVTNPRVVFGTSTKASLWSLSYFSTLLLTDCHLPLTEFRFPYRPTS